MRFLLGVLAALGLAVLCLSKDLVVSTKNKLHNTKNFQRLDRLRFYVQDLNGGFFNHGNKKLENSIPIISDNTTSSQPQHNDTTTPEAKKQVKGNQRIRFLERFFRGFLSIFINDIDILKVTSKICATIFWAYLLLTALGTLGFDTKPLLSLLSISGLTLGFAMKDILTNLFAGIFIIFVRPFKRGQIITVNNVRGKVVSIDIRYCRLLSLKDRSEILIPLSMVYGNSITIEKDEINTSL